MNDPRDIITAVDALWPPARLRPIPNPIRGAEATGGTNMPGYAFVMDDGGIEVYVGRADTLLYAQ